ncbi:hypothetical protein VN97_g9974 [Penicillium thymicola]|uniref:FAD-binding PCMH-type domain-containing protein n=1 Tax=Penicillium thymicola TaxID=293382 RepID=A0AAI9X4J4_PENTH|nr:hypothetical protein VN97_g9974 [Penicillium thymicola]
MAANVFVLSMFAFDTLSNQIQAPDMPCWPSNSEWRSLNETVSGSLIKTIPVASVCYLSEPAYNPETCQSVRSNWTTWPFHSGDPASSGNPTLDNACSPIYANGTSVTGNVNAGEQGCRLGSYPPYIINATSTEDVQAGVRFAKKWNLRVNIKNTGHGGKRSTHVAATLDAGVQDGELYAAMAKHNALAVGGESNDVGVVGWATGGGHGLATGVYGMGADNIIEAVIVTAGGDVLTANACQNEDIFWAIRGGGGGTFGAITSVTVNAYKMPSFAMTGIDISSKNDTSAKDWYRLLARVHGEIPRLQNAGIHGYYTMSGAPMTFSLSLFEYNTMNGTSEAILKPLLEILEAANATATFKTSSLWEPSWYDFIKTVPSFGSTGKMHSTRASRFIPERAVEDIELLAVTLEAIAAPSPDLPGVTVPSISGTMTGSKKPVDNALNPAWRDSIVHVITTQSWDDTLSDDLTTKATHDMTYKRGYALRQLAPDTGAYFNEERWSTFGLLNYRHPDYEVA